MNTIGSAHHMGVLGIQRGVEQIERGAAHIAGAESLDGAGRGLVDALIDMRQGKLQAQASTKTVQTAFDAIGSLLDVKV